MSELRPDTLLCAYSVGLFPMANDRFDPTIYWVEPKERGIIPLERFHTPRRLARIIRQGRFRLSTNEDFPAVIRACAEPTPSRPRTWLNEELIDAYCMLAKLGHAHSVETWLDDRLVGGLYGVALGGAFFGESMFSRASDASKVALVHLVNKLIERQFELLDTQFMTEHLRQFGGFEVTRSDYRRRLRRALSRRATFED
ncbi:MAG: leucyl/phenylalanyl-tRNA--protein transferase [Geminicoccaceae bacterium]